MQSIRWRIAVPFVLLILLIMGGLWLYLSQFIRDTYENDLRDKLTAEARVIGDNLPAVLSTHPAPEAMDVLAKRWAGLLGARVTIISADGQVLGESTENRAQMDNHLDRPEVQQALNSGQGSSIRFSTTAGYDMMYAAVPVMVNNRPFAIARVSLPLQQVQSTVNRLQTALLAATVAATLIAILLAIWIAGRTTAPLRELTEASQDLANGVMQQTLISGSYLEVRKLAQAINTMATRLHWQLQDMQSESSRLSAVLQQMTDGVLIADADGKIQLINPAAERMFGVKSNEALGHTPAEVLRYYQLVDLWRNCKDTGEQQEISMEFGKDRLSLHGVASPLSEALPGSILLLFQDLTRLRKLETIRRDFVSNISHELRTPLASLKALTETLQEGALEDSEMARHFLQQMDTEVDALTQMVTELLELTRIESGQIPLHFIAVAPLEILKPAIERLALQAERAGLILSLDCPADLPAVLADPPRIEQVVANLLHNAIKFTPEGGQIVLAARGEGGEVIFSIQDNGVGIAEADLPRIFERFYKADRARSKGGTGLGLAIARHTVEGHGGRIWVHSVEGRGSTFYFSLPIVAFP